MHDDDDQHECRSSWNEEACEFADSVRRLLGDTERGVIKGVGVMILAAYGHDYADRRQAERSIESVREFLAAGAGGLPLREIGFGMDLSGGTWALLVWNDGPFEEAFRGLWDAVWGPFDEAGEDRSALAEIAMSARLHLPLDHDPEVLADFDVTFR